MRESRSLAKAEACRRFGKAVTEIWHRSAPQMNIREIARRAGYSPTTVSEVVNGRRFPKKEVGECIVGAMGADFETELGQLWRDLSQSLYCIVPAAPVGVLDDTIRATWFQDNSEFYSAARESIATAVREIRVTYVRQYPPSEVSTPEAASYFARMLDWAGEPTARSVKRIFGVPALDSQARRKVIGFLRLHLAEIEKRELRNYQARVYEYTAQGDGLNMALFDRDVAFLAISGFSAQDLTGMRIDDSRFTEYLARHFDQLLPGCTPLGDYIENIDRRG